MDPQENNSEMGRMEKISPRSALCQPAERDKQSANRNQGLREEHRILSRSWGWGENGKKGEPKEVMGEKPSMLVSHKPRLSYPYYALGRLLPQQLMGFFEASPSLFHDTEPWPLTTLKVKGSDSLQQQK